MVPVSRQERRNRPVGPAYKWIALSNTTLGVLMASIDISIVLISLPAIFNGIHVNPLAPGETGYFLWLLLGYISQGQIDHTCLISVGVIDLASTRLYFPISVSLDL